MQMPAGVESSDDYDYVGLYPEGSPHRDNNFCKADVNETSQKASNTRAVLVPDYDPIFGVGGLLVEIWRQVSQSS